MRSVNFLESGRHTESGRFGIEEFEGGELQGKKAPGERVNGLYVLIVLLFRVTVGPCGGSTRVVHIVIVTPLTTRTWKSGDLFLSERLSIDNIFSHLAKCGSSLFFHRRYLRLRPRKFKASSFTSWN